MRDEVPEAQHTQTMRLSPGKSEYPARVLERSCHGGRAGSENLGAFLTRAPNSKGWGAGEKIRLSIKSGEQGAPPLMA